MELETAMADEVRIQDSVLPSNIDPLLNRVCHVCWDNFDILEETPSGSGTTHTTHGIIIQEIDCSLDRIKPMYTNIPKTKNRSFKYIPTELPPCLSKKKVEPGLIDSPPGTQIHVSEPVRKTFTESVWIVCRSLFNTFHTVPD